MKKIIFFILVSILLFSCKFNVIKSPFYSLKNEEVISPMAYFDTAKFTSESHISYEVKIESEEIQNKIKAYQWEVRNIFEDIVAKSDKKSFETNALPADDYIVLLKIIAEDQSSRTFSKKFTVVSVEVIENLVVNGLKADQDTGLSNSDGITKTNTNLEVSGVGEPNSEVILRVKCDKLGTTEDILATTDGSGKATFTIGSDKILEDGFYECKLYKKGNFTSGSKARFIKIDTTVPVISWKAENPTTSFSYGASLIAYSRVSCDELLINEKYTGNFEKAKDGFNPYVCGTQNLYYEAEDKAGNKSSSINRSLTVNEPFLPVLVNGNFDTSVGMDGFKRAGNELKGVATGWDVSCQARVKAGSWWGDFKPENGEGPFMMDPNNNDRTWKDYYCAGVRSDVAKELNSFSFGGWIDCGKYNWVNSHCWYTQVVGSLSQEVSGFVNNVPYKISFWVAMGNEDGNDYMPEKPAVAKIISAGTLFSTDGGENFEQQDEVVFEMKKSSNKDWEQYEIKFFAKKDFSIKFLFEKLPKSSIANNEWGSWLNIDEIKIAFDNLKYVD